MGSGVEVASNGSTANWAEPAKTVNVITSATGIDSPEFTIATPVTNPHTTMAMASGPIAPRPSRNAARSIGGNNPLKAARRCIATIMAPARRRSSVLSSGHAPNVVAT